MKRRTRSILEELNSLRSVRSTELLVENTGQNLIVSAVNLLNVIRETYSEEEAGELERRFLNAIRNNDPQKFVRGLKKVNESRKQSRLDD